MAIEVKIPAVGESITSGVVSAWHKKSGEFVNEGEGLFTLETDKVSTEIVAEKAGVLETKVPEGQEVKIGEVVAMIDDSKRRARGKKVRRGNRKRKRLRKKRRNPNQTKVAEEKAAVAAGADRGRPQPTAAATTLSPAVRRIVEEEKLEPEKIRGTGEGGRLTKGDVLAAAEKRGKADLSAEALAEAEEKLRPAKSNHRRWAVRPQKNVAVAPQDRAATGDGAAHRRHPHHVQRMRHERGPGIAPQQTRGVHEKERRQTGFDVVLC